jgi:hypothetical protein
MNSEQNFVDNNPCACIFGMQSLSQPAATMKTLYSEDIPESGDFHGLRIVNPFFGPES